MKLQENLQRKIQENAMQLITIQKRAQQFRQMQDAVNQDVMDRSNMEGVRTVLLEKIRAVTGVVTAAPVAGHPAGVSVIGVGSDAMWGQLMAQLAEVPWQVMVKRLRVLKLSNSQRSGACGDHPCLWIQLTLMMYAQRHTPEARQPWQTDPFVSVPPKKRANKR